MIKLNMGSVKQDILSHSPGIDLQVSSGVCTTIKRKYHVVGQRCSLLAVLWTASDWASFRGDLCQMDSWVSRCGLEVAIVRGRKRTPWFNNKYCTYRSVSRQVHIHRKSLLNSKNSVRKFCVFISLLRFVTWLTVSVYQPIALHRVQDHTSVWRRPPGQQTPAAPRTPAPPSPHEPARPGPPLTAGCWSCGAGLSASGRG